MVSMPAARVVTTPVVSTEATAGSPENQNPSGEATERVVDVVLQTVSVPDIRPGEGNMVTGNCTEQPVVSE
jgi:hypothetical protein